MFEELSDSELVNLLGAAAILVIAFALSRLSGLILDQVRGRLLRRTKTKLDDMIAEAIKGPLRVALLAGGVQLALVQTELVPDSWWEVIGKLFFFLYAVLVYVLAYRAVGIVVAWYGQEVVFQTETDLDDKFLSFFRRLSIAIVTAIVVVVVLGEFGIEPSALVTTLGIGSLAIALAAQATLGDIIAGFVIMVDRPFAIGDRVELLDIDTWGDVVEIGLRSTRILTRDNRMVSIPNSVIGKGLIVNYSDPNTVYRVQTHVGIAYGTDVEFARKIMIEALTSEEWVMRERPVEALLLEFGDSALFFRVRCWIEHYVETRRVIDKMNTALYKALAESNIEIPVPQRDIRLLGSSVAPVTQS